MSRVIPIIPLILFLAAGCATTGRDDFVKRSDKVESFTLRTRGEPGQHFTAKLNIDGREREISGISPASILLQACVLTGTIRKTLGEGTLGFQILVANSTLGFGALEEPGQRCRFRYHDNGISVWE